MGGDTCSLNTTLCWVYKYFWIFKFGPILQLLPYYQYGQCLWYFEPLKCECVSCLSWSWVYVNHFIWCPSVCPSVIYKTQIVTRYQAPIRHGINIWNLLNMNRKLHLNFYLDLSYTIPSHFSRLYHPIGARQTFEVYRELITLKLDEIINQYEN